MSRFSQSRGTERKRESLRTSTHFPLAPASGYDERSNSQVFGATIMKTSSAAGALLIGGLGLLLLSAVAPFVLGGRLSWSDAEARQLQLASQNYHALMHKRAHGEASNESAELVEARAAFEQHRKDLDTAQLRGATWSSRLRWWGLILCIAGVAWAVAIRIRGSQ